MEAVIVTGVKDDRMGCISKNTPKSLLTIGNVSVLEHQIRALRDAGVERVTVVSGYLGEKIKSCIEKVEIDDLNIRFIANARYENTGTATSFLYGLLGIDDNIVYLNEGAVFEPAAVAQLTKGKHITLGIKSSCSSSGLFIRSNPDNQLVAGIILGERPDDCSGEFAGALWIPQRCLLDLRCKIHTILKSPSKQMFSVEEALQTVFKSGTKIEWRDLSGFWCVRIDTLSDLNRARASWNSAKQWEKIS